MRRALAVPQRLLPSQSVPLLRPALAPLAARGHAVPSARPPWPLPDASISPKLLTPESRAVVSRELARFDAQLPITKAPTPPSSWYISPLFAQVRPHPEPSSLSKLI